jgi:transglutaminase-like putative cysteine protease
MVPVQWFANSRLALPTDPAEVEDSILLRVLVQGLVTVGIASVAVAAVGVTQTSLWNLLAIPLSLVGAIYSWQRRRKRNTAMKFAIALGMLLALGAFFSRLLQEPGDTRIILAELLIQLQVLHSFDLPRRKDLGYSMMIGLILMGVAATISQTFSFAPMLLLFLVLALPVLVLDYQSRLGLKPGPWQQVRVGPALRQFLALLGVTVALGLVIFLFLPRLPGYQIQNFPVSSTIDIDEGFDGQSIINPGYINDGGQGDQGFEDGGGGTIQGQGQATGPGQVDTTSYYGFNQTMNQNLRGVMTPEVVMRVRSQAPGFWRVLAFDHYTGQGWEISRNEEVQTLTRSRFSNQTLLPMEPTLNRQREIVQTYTMVSNLPNLIPALHQARELYFPTREVAIDPEGSLRSPVGLEQGLTYTVISRVPFRDRTLLRQAPTTYPAEIRQHYLQVPEAIRDRVRQRTEELLATSPVPLTDPYEKALYLAQALKQRYKRYPDPTQPYSPESDLPFLAEDQDLVEAFLFTIEGGYPDHFSTTLTIMLRSIGIPARLVAGFGEGQFNPFTGFYVVQNVDAYALTEVYFPQYGWFGFDPIPGHELLPPSLREYETFSTVRRLWNWVAGWLPSPVLGFLDGVRLLVTDILVSLVRVLGGLMRLGWVGIVLGLAGATALAFAGWLAWIWLRLGWRRWQLRQLPPTERLYQQMLTWFEEQGHPKRPSETPLEYSQRLYHTTHATQAQAAGEIAHAYVRWRYGGEEQNTAYLAEKLKLVRRSQPAQNRSRWRWRMPPLPPSSPKIG